MRPATSCRVSVLFQHKDQGLSYQQVLCQHNQEIVEGHISTSRLYSKMVTYLENFRVYRLYEIVRSV